MKEYVFPCVCFCVVGLIIGFAAKNMSGQVWPLYAGPVLGLAIGYFFGRWANRNVSMPDDSRDDYESRDWGGG